MTQEQLESKIAVHIELLRQIYASQGESEFYNAVLAGCVADTQEAIAAFVSNKKGSS